MSHYEVVKVRPNQDVGRLLQQIEQRNMRIVTVWPRASGAELIIEPAADWSRAEPSDPEANVAGMQLAFQARVAEQQRREAEAARARVADQEQSQKAEALIAALSPSQREELCDRAMAGLSPPCRARPVIVRSMMHQIAMADEPTPGGTPSSLRTA